MNVDPMQGEGLEEYAEHAALGGEEGEENDDIDIERLKAKVAEMEAQLKEETEAVEASKDGTEAGNDDASVYIGQVCSPFPPSLTLPPSLPPG